MDVKIINRFLSKKAKYSLVSASQKKILLLVCINLMFNDIFLVLIVSEKIK